MSAFAPIMRTARPALSRITWPRSSTWTKLPSCRRNRYSSLQYSPPAPITMHSGDYAPLVVGVNALVPGLDRAIRRFARIAEHLGEVLVPPDFVGEQVPVPDHVVGGPHRHVEALVALAQRLLPGDALADVARRDDDDPGVARAHHASTRFARQLRAVLAAVIAPDAFRD